MILNLCIHTHTHVYTLPTVQHKTSKVLSNTPNGTHSLDTDSQPTADSGSDGKSTTENGTQPLPQEPSHNGVSSVEENPSLQEDNIKVVKKELEANEEEIKSEEEIKTEQVTPPPPPPPSLVQSSAMHEPTSESKATVRTAPPALVGYESLDTQDSGKGTMDEGEMESKDSEVCSVDADSAEQPTVVMRHQIEENEVVHNDKDEDKDTDSMDASVQHHQHQQHQLHDVREESPDLVIDIGSSQMQSDGENDHAPVIREPETENHEKDKQTDLNLTTNDSQLPSISLNEEQTGEPSSPHSSSSSNDEDVDLEMDIIEEGEDEGGTPPPLPPPVVATGTLMKPPSTAAVTASISQAHFQPLSSTHPRIGVSPSHTASRLAMENLRKSESVVRKPNVIMTSPSSNSAVGLGTSRGGGNPNKEGDNDPGKDRHSVVTDSFRVRQVAKVKQFFTTLQKFGNKNGSEVAEQVQELITAVVVSVYVGHLASFPSTFYIQCS